MSYTLHLGDCVEVIRTLPAGSCQACITSPPYYGLRDYGTAAWEGGDAACDHKQATARHDGGRVNVNGFHGSATVDSDKGAMNYRDTCGKCGARRIDQQIGLEETPSCGLHGQMRIKKDLTPDQLRYVIQRLLDGGLLYGRSYDTNGTK